MIANHPVSNLWVFQWFLPFSLKSLKTKQNFHVVFIFTSHSFFNPLKYSSYSNSFCYNAFYYSNQWPINRQIQRSVFNPCLTATWNCLSNPLSWNILFLTLWDCQIRILPCLKDSWLLVYSFNHSCNKYLEFNNNKVL